MHGGVRRATLGDGRSESGLLPPSLQYFKWTMTPLTPGFYLQDVPLKIRVIAAHGSRRKGPVPTLVYTAEAYDDHDNFRERKWACDHAHESVEHALNCGTAWLESIVDRAKGQRPEPAA